MEELELAAILDCVALPVWVVDHDGHVLFLNPAGLAALGYDELDELRGRPGHDTIHYLHRDGSPYPAEECPMTRARGMGVTVRESDDWFIRRDGSMFPVSYTSTPIDLPGGQGAVVAFEDMTEQREAEQALREREAILASVDQPVWVLDQDGDFHYLNPAAVAALGYDGRRRAAGPAGACDGPLQASGRRAVSGRGVHARAGPDARGDAARARRLPRPQGRVDHARDVLDVAVRARRRASDRSPRSATSRSAGARSGRRASATWPRRGPRSSRPRGAA